MEILIFLFGLAVGSFLNVCIDRLPKNQSVLLGRSRCDHCKKTIHWHDLIPAISFFVLGGRCRYCKKRISWQYPVVEFGTAILFVLTSMLIGAQTSVFPSLPLLFTNLVIVSGLLVILIADYKYRIIPDQLLIVLVAATAVLIFLQNQSYISHITTGGVFFLIFLSLVFVTGGRGMGMGDVKYAFFMGFLLGFPSSLIAFYVAFLTGAVVSLILIYAGKKRMKSTIAFGPFLVGATFVSFYWGNDLWRVVAQFLGISV